MIENVTFIMEHPVDDFQAKLNQTGLARENTKLYSLAHCYEKLIDFYGTFFHYFRYGSRLNDFLSKKTVLFLVVT